MMNEGPPGDPKTGSRVYQARDVIHVRVARSISKLYQVSVVGARVRGVYIQTTCLSKESRTVWWLEYHYLGFV